MKTLIKRVVYKVTADYIAAEEYFSDGSVEVAVYYKR